MSELVNPPQESIGLLQLLNISEGFTARCTTLSSQECENIGINLDNIRDQMKWGGDIQYLGLVIAESEYRNMVIGIIAFLNDENYVLVADCNGCFIESAYYTQDRHISSISIGEQGSKYFIFLERLFKSLNSEVLPRVIRQ